MSKNQQISRMKLKIGLIKTFNIFKESGDKTGCVNDFFNNCNSNLGLSIPTDFTEDDNIGDFFSKMDLDNKSYTTQIEILEYTI